MTPQPTTTPRYAVAVTLPGQAEAFYWQPKPSEPPYTGTQQQAEAQARVVRLALPDKYAGAVVEAVPVVVTVMAEVNRE
jgi:hypothetical protein